MKTLRLSVIVSVIALLSTFSAHAQVAGGGTRHFEKNGLEFDYPVAWQMTDGSAQDSQYVEVASAGKSAQLMVNWQFEPTLSCEVDGIRKRISQALADRVATQIHSLAPAEEPWQKLHLGKVDADQKQLRGSLNNIPVIADVYSLAVNHYFLNLVYLRVANDPREISAWETIRTSLKVGELSSKTNLPSPGGVLNGKAIRLPRPDYPALAKAAHASGVVVVEVLIDEQGNVASACVVMGHAALRNAAEDAARGAKFTPTKLSGKPVRVHGIITYNFVGR